MKKVPKPKADAKTPKPPPKSPPEAEQQILRSFIELSYLNGARFVNYYHVAEHAKIAYTTVLYHFPPKKRDIADAAVMHMFQQSYQFLEEHMFARQAAPNYNPVLTYVDVMFAWLEERPAYASYLCYFYYLLTSKTETTFTNEVFIQRAYLRIEAYIHESVGRQLYPQPKDIKTLVAQIHSIITGCALVASISRSKKVLDVQKAACVGAVESLLKGN